MIWLDAVSVHRSHAHRHLVGFINIMANNFATSSRETSAGVWFGKQILSLGYQMAQEGDT